MGLQDFQWVDLETSLQWQLFRQAIDLLKERNNTVFVLVGPFNEHMFKQDGIAAYRQMKGEIGTWLRQNNVAYYMPEALPSELYHDASHPSAQGYALLARQLLVMILFDPSFCPPVQAPPQPTPTEFSWRLPPVPLTAQRATRPPLRKPVRPEGRLPERYRTCGRLIQPPRRTLWRQHKVLTI